MLDYSRITMLAFLWLMALALYGANGQLYTKYSVKTEMSTFTRTILTSTICVSLAVNPMPVCRRRMHAWIQEPIHWSPDGHQQHHQFIQPTNVYQVEPTAESAVPWFRDAQNSGYDENYLYWNLAHAVILQPSLLMPAVSDLYYRRIPFESVLMNSNEAEENLAQNRQMKTTIVLTFTKPTTELETTTKTQTIKVSGCTPVPFPYDVCLP
ncbi:hypothetical protein DAPPUDRAFT_302599 [Daphnia pulex]|uniref:Uncharacterized protein n=1 Tax=Daphnia pulex TaxID=6669 RepID=E9GDN7_DAPPU|nr:hypothetical protein DAPPUDRAFT_302599 [Daphnia pulex]|eukprot:EFX82114.1 hypothetical protein DAPPUDRAFT_302599 [Daphnia pulex]